MLGGFVYFLCQVGPMATFRRNASVRWNNNVMKTTDQLPASLPLSLQSGGDNAQCTHSANQWGASHTKLYLCRNASFSLLGSDLNLTQLVRNFALLCYFSLCKRTKEGMKLEQKMFAHCLLFPRLPCPGAAVTSCSPPSRNSVRHPQTSCWGLGGINQQDNWHK